MAILNVHRLYPGIEKDIKFVYSIMRLAFPSPGTLGTHTLNGTAVFNTDDGSISEIKNQLDSRKIEAIFKQYKIRVLAEGINDEERRARVHRSIFNRYITKLHETEKKTYERAQKKMAHQ